MAMPIAPINTIQPVTAALKPSATAIAQPGVFQAMLSQSVQSVEQASAISRASVDRFLSGEGEELHKVAMSAQEAEISFDLFMQVRNKVVSAYQEIMRMQV